MKRFSLRKLAIYIGIGVLLLPLAGLATATPAPQGDRGGAPNVISYQGQVLVGGSPYSGTGYFKFAIVDSAGTTSYWSNDGTSTGGSQPMTGVMLTVDVGLFNVLLGDTNLAGMTRPLAASAFTGTDRYLRVWFSSDNSTYQQLSPDQRIAAVAYAYNADTLDGADGNAYQLRVSGYCSVGSTIQSINTDGSVACEAHDTRLGFYIFPPNIGGRGQYNSITIGADGFPVISYYDETNSDLIVTHCKDTACLTFTHTIVDGSNNAGKYTAITIGLDGFPAISYYRGGELRYAHCQNFACSASEYGALDGLSPGDDVGMYTSITIGTDGFPVISYYDKTNSDLKIAHISSGSPTINVVDATGDVGLYTSITIGVDGLPVISYYDATNTGLKVAHCNDLDCASSTQTAIAYIGDVGLHTSITIGSDGLPVISYYDLTNSALKIAHCTNIACTASSNITVDSTGIVGEYTAITIGADGLPVISYYDYTNGALKVAHCSDTACTVFHCTTVDTLEDVGQYTSIAIGVDGLPVISYYDVSFQNLNVAHCSNAFCIPYWRRR